MDNRLAKPSHNRMSVRETATRFADAGSVGALLGTNSSSRSKCAVNKKHATGRNGTGKSGARVGLHRLAADSRGSSPTESATASVTVHGGVHVAVHSAQKAGKSTQSKSGPKGKNASKANSPVATSAVTGEEPAADRVRKRPIIGSKKLKKEKTAPPAQQDSSSQFDQFTSVRTGDRQPSAFTQSNYQVGLGTGKLVTV